MGEVSKLMNYHNVKIQRSEAGNHRAQAFVERANRTLSEKLFSHQYAQEMIGVAGPSGLSDNRSRVWVKRLPDILKTLNNTPTRITGKEPGDAIKMKGIDIKPKKYLLPGGTKRVVGFDEVRLPIEVSVRYLLSPGELEGGEKRRATDPIWSIKVYYISGSKVSPNQPVLYFYKTGQDAVL